MLKQSSVRQSIEEKKKINLFFWSILYTKRAVVYFLNNSDKIDSDKIDSFYLIAAEVGPFGNEAL